MSGLVKWTLTKEEAYTMDECLAFREYTLKTTTNPNERDYKIKLKHLENIRKLRKLTKKYSNIDYVGR